ncbi:Calcium-binding protein [Spathaspora sp. JA1]|nr:Calcium-binding protein [Spathaspora sp. JA1]
MAFLFKRNPKTPQDLVRSLIDQVNKLDSSSDTNKKYQDECSRFLHQIKLSLYGTEDDSTEVIIPHSNTEQVNYLVHQVIQSDCLFHLISNLNKLDFDSRKDVVALFSHLSRRQFTTSNTNNNTNTDASLATNNTTSTMFVDYLTRVNPDVLSMLIKGPESRETGLICGQILRECIKYEQVNRIVLNHPLFWNYFKYVEIPVFEIATDSFTTLHDLLIDHKKLTVEWLGKNYDKFMVCCNQLISSKNYVTKRQTIKLLSDLLKRHNQEFINRYFDDTNNLKFIMLILSDKSKNLQREAFHIFKFFVVNPKRSQKISDILIKNKENFIEFFNTFDVVSFNDNNLVDERDFVLKHIYGLPDIERIH